MLHHLRLQKVKVLVAQSSLTLWDTMDCIFCPWDSPGKNTGMGSHSLLQRIFPFLCIEGYWYVTIQSCIENFPAMYLHLSEYYGRNSQRVESRPTNIHLTLACLILGIVCKLNMRFTDKILQDALKNGCTTKISDSNT